MAPIILRPHSCEHCEKIVFDRTIRPPPPSNSPRTWDDLHDSNDADLRARTLPDFTLAHLLEGSEDGCELCSWILNDECITLETIAGLCSWIADDMLRKSMEQASMWVTSLIPSTPEQTTRALANEKPKDFEKMCLFLGAKIDADILRVEFFGLWDPDGNQIVCRTRHGFRVQVPEDSPAAAYVTTRPIDDEAGSSETFAKISLWRATCLQEHHDSCPTPNSTFVPKRLVEVQDADGFDCLRLRETEHVGHPPYIPLSYCWGDDQAIISTRTTVSTWMKSIPYDHLPQTLKDAITACRNLQVRFLWVDALCIVQDDDQDRSQQIALMPQIYRNGQLTIAAASAADAREGFLHRRQLPNSETTAFTLPYVCPDAEKSHITLYRLDERSSPLDTRAWTMQERLLSPRTLEFSNHQVRWLCRGCLDQPGWTDGWLMKPEVDSRQHNILPKEVFGRAFNTAQLVPQTNNLTDPKASKKDWYALVRAYTHRALKRPTDRILALSGLAKEYSVAVDDAYLAGMWRKSLLTELLWTVEGTTYPAPTSFQGPSWSWTSVNGTINFKGQYGSFHGRSEEQAWAKVVDCNPTLVEGSAPFGAVKENQSSLVLEARLLPAMLLPSSPPSGLRSSEEHQAIVMKMNDDGKMQQFRVEIDASDFANRAAETAPSWTEIVLLELFSTFMSSQWTIKGLVLRSGTLSRFQNSEVEQRPVVEAQNDTGSFVSGPLIPESTPPASSTDYLRYQRRLQQVKQQREMEANRLYQQRNEPDENVFYRVGMFDYTSSYSQEAYNKNALRECNWFKYCVPRAAKIL
ncbi:hypothetical protein CB0940_06888 [Cercospora beticola]|uniref:Heterokaryon incompatibility domain-containing protein n=1 Tax=Cercospora beticola TaxID=122368 RepID=A0A2G5H9I6_CERBT|nr:hypothetical protein CB0940_06888 [Cercospora beticola]PIA89190.1 hypothetical protein CB0940_06888 [Cercospora beticola]